MASEPLEKSRQQNQYTSDGFAVLGVIRCTYMNTIKAPGAPTPFKMMEKNCSQTQLGLSPRVNRYIWTNNEHFKMVSPGDSARATTPFTALGVWRFPAGPVIDMYYIFLRNASIRKPEISRTALLIRVLLATLKSVSERSQDAYSAGVFRENHILRTTER